MSTRGGPGEARQGGRRGQLRLRPRVLAGIATGLAAVLWLATYTAPLRQLEAWTIDLRLGLLAPPSPARERIVIVAIDEQVLAELPYRSPIDRGLMADLVDAVDGASPRAIGLDLLFDQATEPAKDGRLRQRLLEAAAPVVVAWGERRHGLTPAQVAYLESFIEGLRPGEAIFRPDPLDGRVRIVNEAGGEVPAFAAALLAAATGQRPTAQPFFLAPALPAAEGAFRVLPARVVLQDPQAVRPWLQDRIVLIGATLPGQDRHEIARGIGSLSTPGVEVHGHVLARLIDGFQPQPAPAWAMPAMLLLVAGISVVLVGLRMRTRTRLLLGGTVVLALLAIVLWLTTRELILPMAAPIQTALIAVATTRLRIAGVDRARRRFLHRAFGKYIAPALVERLLDNPEELKVGGSRRRVTAFYTDLEGFTAMTEDLPPESLVELLNRYLDGVCRIVADHGGTIDKLVGDAVVALFNAPLDQPGHEAMAVRAALAVDRFARDFAEQQTARLGRRFGRTRIGVATGTVTVGNFGGDVVFDYTAQGAAMNLGARLEAANRELGTTICVDGTTARACPEVSFQSMGTVRAKGFAEPVPVFTPMAAKEEADDDATTARGAA